MTSSRASRASLQSTLVQYFGNPKLQKETDTDRHSIYYCIIKSSVGYKKRYLIVTTLLDIYPLQSIRELSDILWISFQTRTLDVFLHVPIHTYTPVQQMPFTEPLTKIADEKGVSVYKFDNPMYSIWRVRLLESKEQIFSYPNKGNLSAACETFCMIIDHA